MQHLKSKEVLKNILCRLRFLLRKKGREEIWQDVILRKYNRSTVMNMIRPRRYARIVRSCESYPLKTARKRSWLLLIIHFVWPNFFLPEQKLSTRVWIC